MGHEYYEKIQNSQFYKICIVYSSVLKYDQNICNTYIKNAKYISWEINCSNVYIINCSYIINTINENTA